MITLFNRRELCITRNLEEQAKIRDVLQINHIKYKMKIIDHHNYGSEVLTRTASKKREILYEFYVYKADYECASYLIRTKQR